MTVPQTPDDPQPDVDEVPDPVKATEPKAEPAPDEREEATGPVVAAPGIGGATTTPMPPVPPAPNVGSGH